MKEGEFLKSEQDIKNEIESAGKTIENYQKAHKEGKIPFEILKTEHLYNSGMIQALRWVLGENDRYD